MKKIIFSFCFVLIFSIFSFSQYNYPVSKTVDSADTYWGVTVKDPYRWLEDIKNPEVQNWFKAQADYTNAQLAKIPNQDIIFNELKALDTMRSARYTPIKKTPGKYFYTKRLPDQQNAKLYYLDISNNKEVLLFDPEKYSTEKKYSFTASVSDDGTKVILPLEADGNEVAEIRILDVATAQLLPDVIPHSVWPYFVAGSNDEILYSQLKSYDVHTPDNMLNCPQKLHKIGTPFEQDKVLVSSEKNPELNIASGAFPSIFCYPNSPYMIMGKFTVENNRELYYAMKSELHNEKINWKPLTTLADEVRDFWVDGFDFYYFTPKNNPLFTFAKTNLQHPDFKNPEILLKGSDDWKLTLMSNTKDYITITKSKNDLQMEPYVYNMRTGDLSPLQTALSGLVSPTSISTIDNEILFINSGWTIPFNMYNYDIDTKKLSDGPFHATYHYNNMENIAYEEIEIPSYDGVLIPVSLIYDKTKLKKDGSNIGYMYGYGAYGFSIAPVFRNELLPLVQRGVLLAVAHVRGGGEKGDDWYLGGKKTTKPNTWKDFNATAEYLIQHKYTSADRLAISGGSAGGILIGRAITERPDLYRVAIPTVGCLNALRMEISPNGPGNIAEFGTVKDSVEFKALLEMDAYQHIQKGVKYPAQLITTGFNDFRVDSWVPAKFAAKMQADNASAYPVFLDVNYESGHFGSSDIDSYYKEQAKQEAFVLWQCGDKDFQIN